MMRPVLLVVGLLLLCASTVAELGRTVTVRSAVQLFFAARDDSVGTIRVENHLDFSSISPLVTLYGVQQRSTNLTISGAGGPLEYFIVDFRYVGPFVRCARGRPWGGPSHRMLGAHVWVPCMG